MTTNRIVPPTPDSSQVNTLSSLTKMLDAWLADKKIYVHPPSGVGGKYTVLWADALDPNAAVLYHGNDIAAAYKMALESFLAFTIIELAYSAPPSDKKYLLRKAGLK